MFTKSTGKHLWHSLFINKIASLRPATFLRKSRWFRFFPLIFAKFEEHFFTEAEHLRTTASEPLTNLHKGFIADVWLASKYAFYMQC